MEKDLWINIIESFMDSIHPIKGFNGIDFRFSSLYVYTDEFLHSTVMGLINEIRIDGR